VVVLLFLFCFFFSIIYISFSFFDRGPETKPTAHFAVAVPSSPAPVRRSTGSSFMRPTASSVAKDKDILGPVLVKSSIRPAVVATSVAQRPKML
jgi:hypothetical protein